MNKKWWRVVHDVFNYKSPIQRGKILTPHRLFYMTDKFDPTEFQLEFDADSRREKGLTGDFPRWIPGCLYASERARNHILPMMRNCCREFFIPCSALPYYLFIVDIEIDAFDYSGSDYTEWSGVKEEIDKVQYIKKIKLRNNIKLDNYDIFRLKGNIPLNLEIIVSDKFRDICISNRLTGLNFESTINSI